MKKILLIGLVFMIGLAVVAQKPQVKQGFFVKNFQKEQAITLEPFEKISPSSFTANRSGMKSGNGTDIVSVIDLGTSANAFGFYSGTRTMLWADDNLNAVVNFHRAGPGSTPPSLSGYYAMDIGVNMGMTAGDWTNQVIAANALLASSPYYYDAGRYPSAAIYNPAGNTDLANAYCAYFGPNFANLVVSGFGGYSYGTVNLVNYADSARHIRWYDPTPYTYIPGGFTVSATGVAHMLDGSDNVESGSVVYQDSVIYGRGVWNTTTTDYDYTFITIPMQCKNMYGVADQTIAASPDGNTVWMSVLTDYANSAPSYDTATYYPLVRRSTDGGNTWEDPIPVYLGGPNGIAGIKNNYSDYFIQNFFVGPPWPTRDEIPYTCAFDHNISVDKWGNPHIAVVVGYSPGGYSISTGIDSLLTVFDIYSVDDGATWSAVAMGSLTTFRGTFGDVTMDNRVYISRNMDGDKMFVTWNDTKIEGETNNQNPDVFARGFDLITNMLTSVDGANEPNNVTFLSDITTEAYLQYTSPFVFTDNDKYTLPIATIWFTDSSGETQCKYVPDFSYVDADFTIPVVNDPFPVGVDQKREIASVKVYPNPVKDYATVNVNLTKSANVTLEVTNIVGQQVMLLDKGNMNSGSQKLTIDATSYNTGVYFVTVTVNGQKFTQKMIVE